LPPLPLGEGRGEGVSPQEAEELGCVLPQERRRSHGLPLAIDERGQADLRVLAEHRMLGWQEHAAGAHVLVPHELGRRVHRHAGNALLLEAGHQRLAGVLTGEGAELLGDPRGVSAAVVVRLPARVVQL
jgi:hypothetical protein